ncbi:hypothetical protein PIB30_042617 [Stylosanthes scabra]|uniref:Uncharacterized protein n=1 Tax=Stylosanthes scabra TaxID=79078 RepID=A0ABU6XD06_9FABA|nr:hypothetical protein [Stylosanthes scabra]
MPDPSAGHELMRRLFTRNPTLPGTSPSVIQGSIHARTAFRPRLGVGFHHSPRLGVARKSRACQDQVATRSRRESQHHDRARSTPKREPNAVQPQASIHDRVLVKWQCGFNVTQPQVALKAPRPKT